MLLYQYPKLLFYVLDYFWEMVFLRFLCFIIKPCGFSNSSQVYCNICKFSWSSILFFFFFLCCLWPHLWYIEMPRLGVKLELQLLTYTTATAMQDLSRICNLHYSSQQHQILNPLSEARDWTWVLVDTCQIRFTELQCEHQFCLLLTRITDQHKTKASINDSNLIKNHLHLELKFRLNSFW